MMEDYPNSYYFNSINRTLIKHASLKDDHDCDLCIVGGGFTGLSTAIESAKKGLKVILLEQNKIGWGASGRNGGQVWPDLSNGVEVIEQKYDLALAKQMWNISLDAVDLIDERIKEFGIKCEKKSGGILAATNSFRLKDFEDDKKYFENNFNYTETEILDKEQVSYEIGSNRYYGGFLHKRAGHLHPLKYALGLADAAILLNVKIYEDSRVEKIIENKKDNEILLSNGKVKAKNVAVCCNAYIKGLNLGFENKIMPVDTYVIGTKPLSHNLQKEILPNDYCVSDTNFALNYYRLSEDKRLLFGGGVSYSLKNVEKLKKRTKKQVVKVFPQILDQDVDFLWGGHIAITVNRVPDIGQLRNNIFYAQGFSGHGIALTGIAGKILAESIFSDKSQELEIFEKIKHNNFPGGRIFRMPLLVTISAMQRMMDIFNA